MNPSTRFLWNSTAIAAAALACSACAGSSAALGRAHTAGSDRVAMSSAGPVSDATPNAHYPRTSEETLCADVPAAERDQGPLSSPARITAVEPLSERPHPKEFAQPSGAAVYLLATPGLTQEWLGRVLACHIAHHAVVGDRVPDITSPLYVENARIAVSSTGDGFRIAITSTDVDTARLIIERANAIVQ